MESPSSTRGVLGRRPVQVAGLVFFLGFLLAGRLLVVDRPVAAPDLIVMLTGHEWERLPATALVALANPRARVVVSIPKAVSHYSSSRCDQRVQQLVDAGVARDRIVELTPPADNTKGEAEGVAEYVGRTGVQRVLMVTSAYHTRRTAWLFRRPCRRR